MDPVTPGSDTPGACTGVLTGRDGQAREITLDGITAAKTE